MTKLLGILFLVVSFQIKAQNDTTNYHGFDTVRHVVRTRPANDSDLGYRNAVKFDGLRFIDYLHTATLFSYERYMGEYWAMEASLGLMHKYMYVNNKPDAWSTNSGYMTDLHLKYYIDGNDPWWESMYIGLKGRFFKYSLTKGMNYRSDSLFMADTTAGDYFNYETNIGQDKQQWAIQLTVGIHGEWADRLEWEFGGALGVGHRQVTQRFLKTPPSDLKGPYFGEAIRLHTFNAPGYRWTPVISMHAKLGINWGIGKKVQDVNTGGDVIRTEKTVLKKRY